jgi:hypothetical protein
MLTNNKQIQDITLGWTCLISNNNIMETSSKGFIHAIANMSAVTEIIWSFIALFIIPLPLGISLFIGIIQIAIDYDAQNDMEKLNLNSNSVLGLISSCNSDVAITLNFIWIVCTFILISFTGSSLYWPILHNKQQTSSSRHFLGNKCSSPMEIIQGITWIIFIACAAVRFMLDLGNFIDPYEGYNIGQPKTWSQLDKAIAARATRHLCVHSMILIITLLENNTSNRLHAVIALCSLGIGELSRALFIVFYYQNFSKIYLTDLQSLDIITIGYISVAILACCVFGMVFGGVSSMIEQARQEKEKTS